MFQFRFFSMIVLLWAAFVSQSIAYAEMPGSSLVIDQESFENGDLATMAGNDRGLGVESTSELGELTEVLYRFDCVEPAESSGEFRYAVVMNLGVEQTASSDGGRRTYWVDLPVIEYIPGVEGYCTETLNLTYYDNTEWPRTDVAIAIWMLSDDGTSLESVTFEDVFAMQAERLRRQGRDSADGGSTPAPTGTPEESEPTGPLEREFRPVPSNEYAADKLGTPDSEAGTR